MKNKHFQDLPVCPLEATLERSDGRWKGVVLYQLLANDLLRFNELQRGLQGMSQHLLTKQKQHLEAVGSRTVSSASPHPLSH